jgi:hypothetical protein
MLNFIPVLAYASRSALRCISPNLRFYYFVFFGSSTPRPSLFYRDSIYSFSCVAEEKTGFKNSHSRDQTNI